MQDGLVLWLDANAQRQLMKDGQSKSIWKDLSGNGNDGQLMNFDFTEDSGWVDGGLKFDGVDDWLQLDRQDKILDGASFTISFVLKIIEPHSVGVMLFGNEGLKLRIMNYKPLLNLKAWGDSKMVTELQQGTTHYVDFSYSDGRAKIYIDGTLSVDQTKDIEWDYQYYQHQDFRVNQYASRYSDILIYKISIYNRALTDEEILQNYRATHFLLEPKTFTSTSYYNFYDLNRVEINTLATKDLAEVLRGDISLESINFDRDMKSIPFADVLNRVEGNINILGNKLYKPKGWAQPKLDWRYNQPFSYEDANRLEKNLLLLYRYAKGNIDNFKYCGAYTCGEAVV